MVWEEKLSWNASDLDALEMEGGTAGRVLSNELRLFAWPSL